MSPGPVDPPEPEPEPEPEPNPIIEPSVVVAVADDPAAPTLPASTSDSELLEAVGATRRPVAGRNRRPENVDEPPAPRRPPPEAEADEADDQRAVDPPSRRRLWFTLAAAVLVGGTIAGFVLLGRANSDSYAIVCTSDKIVAEQGRTFPPWGEKPMSGPEWKPIEIPPNAECEHLETDDPARLASTFQDALVKRATILLTGEVTKIELAEQQLNQALLLARAPAQKPQRESIERLLGDVGYWRASAKLRDASTALGEAAKQFDAAAAQRPRIATDASAWANYIRKLADELHVGPRGQSQTFPPIPPVEHPDRPAAPPGVALPIEPEPRHEPASAPPPDAGVPTGGVLL